MENENNNTFDKEFKKEDLSLIVENYSNEDIADIYKSVLCATSEYYNTRHRYSEDCIKNLETPIYKTYNSKGSLNSKDLKGLPKRIDYNLLENICKTLPEYGIYGTLEEVTRQYLRNKLN